MRAIKYPFWILVVSIPFFSNTMYATTYEAANNLRPTVWKTAMHAYYCAVKRGVPIKKPIITLVDYSLPSNDPRLWVVDLAKQKILYHTYVAHGEYSGTSVASHFSDVPGSLTSSLGVFLTKNTYFGHAGYSLQLVGLEKGFNDKAYARHIILHGAWYVGKDIVERYGRIGRSSGCPAVSKRWARPIIDRIKHKTLFVIYSPNRKWLTESRFLHC